jgi:hypothetical protein
MIDICEGVAGVTAYVPLITDSPEYQRVHAEVRKVFGPAIDYDCIQCGDDAHVWAWQHGLNPVDWRSYEPMCRFCHRVYDRTDEWIVNKGDDHPMAKMNVDKVIRLRADHQTGIYSQKDLANNYGIAVKTVQDIIYGKKWKEAY